MTGQHEPLSKPEVLRKDKRFLLRMWHQSWCSLCRIKERNIPMTIIAWPTDVINHRGHW